MFYPVFLDLRTRPCAVIGGGQMAEAKVLALLAAGARVTVVNPDVTPRLAALEAKEQIAIRRRAYQPGDLTGMWLVIAALDDRTTNRQIWEEAEQRGILLNAVDDLPHCSFIAPAIYRQGDLAIAISTAGKSPALAVRLRERLAEIVGPEYATLLNLLGDVRAEVARRVPELRVRTALWYRVVDADVIEFVRRGDVEGAREQIARHIDEAGAAATGQAAEEARVMRAEQ